MTILRKRTMVAALLTALGATSICQAEEPSAILELGGASELDLKDHSSSFGPNFAIEATPIEDVLEIEAGIGPFFGHHRTEWDADFLFKKPWTISDSAEFMIGIGPSWTHTIADHQIEDRFGISAALDFMFWPRPDKKFGWFAEPAYGLNFGHEHEQSLSISIGLLIPIP